MVLKFMYAVVKRSDVLQFAVFGCIPPCGFSGSTDFTEVDLHRSSGIIVYQQIVVSTCSYGTIVTFSVCAGDDRLIRYTYKERKSKHKVLQIFHLIEAGIIHSLLPRFLCAICAGYPRLKKLHDGIITVSMPERAGENRPISVTPYVMIFPSQLVFVMQAMRDFFVDRFSVDDGLQRSCCETTFCIAPVIFFRIFFNGILFISQTLSVTAVSALKHIEVHPGSISEPFCRSHSASRMKRHKVFLID